MIWNYMIWTSDFLRVRQNPTGTVELAATKALTASQARPFPEAVEHFEASTQSLTA